MYEGYIHTYAHATHVRVCVRISATYLLAVLFIRFVCTLAASSTYVNTFSVCVCVCLEIETVCYVDRSTCHPSILMQLAGFHHVHTETRTHTLRELS
jgi:hypothetical protein